MSGSLTEQCLVCPEGQSTTLCQTLKSFVRVVLEDPVIAVFQCFTTSTRRCPTQNAHISTQRTTLKANIVDTVDNSNIAAADTIL